MMKMARPLALAGLAALLVVPTLAVALPMEDLGGLASALLQALQLSGPPRWFALLIVGVMAGVHVLRTFVPAHTGIGQFIRTDEGGTLLAWVVSAGGGLFAKVLVGEAMSWGMVGAAIVTAAGGSGAIWSHARRLLRLLIPLAARIPKIGPFLAQLLGVISGANAKARIESETAKAYRPLDPAPDAKAAAAELSR